MPVVRLWQKKCTDITENKILITISLIETLKSVKHVYIMLKIWADLIFKKIVMKKHMQTKQFHKCYDP